MSRLRVALASVGEMGWRNALTLIAPYGMAAMSPQHLAALSLTVALASVGEAAGAMR